MVNLNGEISADIAIVGGGIGGPALACALRHKGYRVVLVEMSGDPLDTARGDHIQPVVCELLDKWGVLQAFFDQGAEKRLGSHWYASDGEEVLNASIDDLPIPHPYYIYLNHELIGETLLNHAQENPNFTLLRPAKARAIQNDGDENYCLMAETPDGNRTLIRTQLLVAADGRSSQVRTSVGFEIDTYQYKNPIVALFAPRTRSDPRNEVHAYIGSKGIVSVVPRTGDKWKVGVPLARSDLGKWKKSTADERASLIAQYVPSMGSLKTEIAGFYPTVRLNAAHWTKHNVVLIGDACHALHPGRSQGMNVTMRCIDHLVRVLPSPDQIGDPGRLRDALSRYEREAKPPIDLVLADNHRRGLEMDSLDPEKTLSLIQDLRHLQADPKKHFAYRMNAAGYDASLN